MAEVATASCSEHPGRAAFAPCTRCGAFICDWCVKLAPSWGPGLCAKCQKVKHGAVAPPMALSKAFILVSVALFVRPWLSMGGVFQDLTEGSRAAAGHNPQLATQFLVATVADGLLTVLAFVAMGLFWFRRKAARPVIVVMYALDVLGRVAQLLIDGPSVFSLWLVVYLAVDLLVMVWILQSDDARRMLVR